MALYAGGSFRTAGGVDANHIARWNGSQWYPLGSGMWSPYPDYPGVYALAVGPDTSLYAGGEFWTAGGIEADNVARWNGLWWQPLGSGTNDHVKVLAIAPDGSLYAGGHFTAAGGVTTNRIARWDGAQWHPLGSGIGGYAVNALALGPDGSLYAGGRFTAAGGVAANNIARWDGVDWHPLGNGVSSEVYALAVGSDGSLYAGGVFTTAGGVTVNRIARWDGAQWHPLGSGMGGGDYPQVYALAVGPDGSLYAAGEFTTAGGVAANSIARWDSVGWSALGNGVAGHGVPTVNDLAFGLDDVLFAGGSFGTAGDKPSSNFAQWNGEAVRRCDFNDSGVVDVGDILIVAALWNQPAGPPYDLDGDGVITVVDITRTAR